MHAGIHQWAANNNSNNFTLVDQYIPERWLGDSRFINDDREAMKPFSHGPRNCIGKNLAYVEMRLVLARMLFEFGIQLCDGMENWDRAKIFLMWEKKKLNVKLTRRI